VTVPRHRSRGRILRSLALLLVLGAMVAAWGAWRYMNFADTALVLPPADEHVLSIEPGDGFLAVLGKLRRAGVRQGSDIEWRLLSMELGVANRIQVGDYRIDPGMSPRDLLRKFGTGDVIQQRFTLIEGWSFRTVREALAANTQLKPESLGLSDAEIMKRLGREGVHPEGRFLPETYLFARGSSDLDILRRAAEAMDDALAEAWAGREPDKAIDTPDKMLTLASIVEKETGLASERPLIAGVFLRRLELGMLLQTDPTVIYGMGQEYDGNIRKRDLLTDTPYNTYTRAGLPPTPIAMPGRAALEAVAHPERGKALYFVASGGGAHHFSATLDEHNRAVRKYQLKR
jgi:UPF0755 protein